MTRNELADELLEIRRYVKTDVEYVRRRLKLWDADVRLIYLGDLGSAPLFARLTQNLDLGLRFIQVDPEILSGYLYAAAFELRLGRGE